MKTALQNISAFLATCFCMLVSTQAFSQSQQSIPSLQPAWIVEEITDSSIPEDIVPDKREIARNGLPDGRIASGNGDIRQAWYSEPTNRYAHGVLGDATEAGTLKIKDERGRTFTFRLPRSEVFEDITPRLADLDRNGTTEVITILSSKTGGASVAIFGLNGSAFIKLAQTPFIGRANRWLNISGIAHFTGDPRPDIAIVVTPHLAGILQFYRYQNGKLRRIVSSRGYSTHFIGSNELRLSVVADVNSNGIPDLALPSLARNELVFVGREGDKFDELGRVALPARINRAIGAYQKDGKPGFIVGLDNGKIYSIYR